jgi:PAS domain S-box-containing protein
MEPPVGPEAVAESAPVGLFVVDAAGQCTWANASWLELAGLHFDEALGRGWLAAIHPDDRAAVAEQWSTAAAAGAPFAQDIRFERPGQPGRRVLVRATPLRGPGGTVIASCGSAVDVTDLHEAREALAASERLFRAIVETGAEGIVLVGLDNVILFANPAFEQMLGYGRGELVGRHLLDITDTTRQTPRAPELQRWRQGAVERMDYCYRARDGRAVWGSIAIAPLRDSSGTITGAAAMVTDVTERRRTEQLLRDREQRYRRVFEGLHETYVELDSVGRITAASPSSLRHLLLDPSELIGRDFFSLFSIESERDELRRRLERDGGVDEFEAEARRADGQRVVLACNLGRAHDGGPVAYRGTFRDVTSRRQAEDERNRIFEFSIDMLGVLNAKAELIRANPAWERHLGYPMDQVIGAVPFEWMHPDDQPAAIAARDQLVAGRTVHSLRLRLRRADGEYRWFSWSLSPLGRGREVYAIVHDIEDLVANEELQAAAMETLRSALDASGEATVFVEAHTGLVTVNRVCDEWFPAPDGGGYTDFFAHIASHFSDPESVLLALQADVEKDEGTARYVWRQERPEPRDVEVVSKGVVVGERPVGRLFTFRDVTHEREVDRMKSRFVAAASRELRTPLAAVIGYLDLLLEGEAGPLSREQAELLEVARRNATRLTQFVGDLASIERLDALGATGSRGTWPAHELLGEIAATMAGAGIEVRVAGDAPALTGYRESLAGAIERLLAMAAATGGGQPVTVTVTRASDNGVLVSVPLNRGPLPGQDDGDGAGDLALSLGFAVVRSLVEMNGGHVALEAPSGGSASVRVWLPPAADAPPAGTA